MLILMTALTVFIVFALSTINNVHAQTVVLSEDFSSSNFGAWTTYSVASDEDWEVDDYSGNYFAKCSGYGADEASDDWLISPSIDLTPYVSAILNFVTAARYGGPDLEIYASTDYSGSGDPNAANWTQLYGDLSDDYYNWVASGDIDLSSYMGSTVFIAFRYISTGTQSGDGKVWEVDDVVVIGETPDIIESEDFEDDTFGNWKAYSVASDKDWHIDTYSGDTFAKVNGYGGDEASEDWLISPRLNLDLYKNEFFRFKTAARYGGPDLEVWVSTNYSGSGNPNNANWTQIPGSEFDLSDDYYNWVASGDIDISSFNGSSVYIAFKYITSGTGSGEAKLWEVDDIEILGISTYTGPDAFDLSAGDFSFMEWAENETAGTYPANMVFRQSGQRDPELDDEMDSNWPCAYNLTSRSRINGLGADGISFLNTSSTQSSSTCDGASYVGAAVVAIKTIDRTNIDVSWVASTLAFDTGSDDPRLYSIRLQYRNGVSGEFKDVKDEDGNPVEYTMNGSIPNEKAIRATLPYDAEDQPIVHLRWKYYQSYDGSGQRPQLRLDDIEITSVSSVGTPTELAITHVDPLEPMQNVPFDLVVRSVDNDGVAKKVSQPTDVTVSVQSGGGTLSGTLLGTIPAGGNYVVFEALAYSNSGMATFQAESTSGDDLETAAKSIMFIEGPVALEFNNIYNKNHIGVPMPEFTVTAIDSYGEPVVNYNGYEISIERQSGPGNINGTLTASAVNGVAKFSDISFDFAGTYRITATAVGLPDADDQTIYVNGLPEMTEMIIPRIIKGEGSFGTRMPAYALVRLNNLHGEAVYRFNTGGRNVGYGWTGYDPQQDGGAGNNFHYDHYTDTYTYNSSRDSYLRNEGGYSTFETAPGQTSIDLWINLVPTSNSSFDDGEDIYWILNFGNEMGQLIHRYQTTNTSRAVVFGNANENCTGIYDEESWLEEKRFVCLYSDPDGFGMPLSTAIVQDDGGELQSGTDSQGNPYPNQGPVWYADLDHTSGSWATIIPNSEEEGRIALGRIEEFDAQGNLLRVWTDEDGIWAGVNTINPYGGIDNPIIFRTPQLILDNPKNQTELCNDGSNMIQWRSRGVTKVDIEISQDGGESWTSLILGTNAAEGSTDWLIPAGLFSETPSIIKLFSSEHIYIEDQSNEFTIYDRPIITENSESSVNCLSESRMINVVANGSQLTFQWFKDGKLMRGETNGALYLEDMDHSHSAVYTCTVSGHPTCPDAHSDEIVVYVATETEFTRHPEDYGSQPGGKAVFEVQAHVNGVPDDYEIEVQWYKGDDMLVDNDRIAGAKSNYLSIVNLQPGDFADNYYAKIIGLCGEAESERAAIVEVSIVSADVTQTDDCEGDDIVLTCNAVSQGGSGDLLYQWRKDGADLADDVNYSGTTTEELTIKAAEMTDLGEYTCFVQMDNADVSLESDPLDLVIKTAPAITQQPEATLSVDSGRPIELEIVAVGSPVLTYQWYKDGVEISGAVSSTFSKADAQAEDAGEYTCKVMNDCGELISDPAVVAINMFGVAGVSEKAVAGGYMLFASNPNPASAETSIQFMNPKSGKIIIRLNDMLGKPVAVIAEGIYNPGVHKAVFDVSALNIPAGTYSYTLKAEGVMITKTLVVMK